MERIGLGIIIGVGLASLARITRPTAKKALKLGFAAIEAVKGALGEGRERVADLVAEVKDEMAREPEGAGVRARVEPPAG
ncbi:hypothetical protein SOCEGT47_012010 [Sorangium cellulosum]|jgi:hypothetical protein|uniref:Uncharacterized protein n=1 Tax=Sorangium cellulosum TaxID=56 RepID=A0A4P2PW31_SORCE|nr:hypothetical protein [Sorangium cellulosum]AUX20728.1 hypothetical protein SOCEGT47_012010 [Sorangium cellulosum]